MRAISFFVSCAALFAAGPFVPAEFNVPVTYVGNGYKLVPLGPDLVKIDYDAYMSSIEHLQKQLGGKWPHAGLTMEDAMKDMQQEKKFDLRESFAYGVLTPDGKRELGSFYLRPSKDPAFDAAASLWITKERYDKGFEVVLLKDMKNWISKAWPFQKVAWPGR